MSSEQITQLEKSQYSVLQRVYTEVPEVSEIPPRSQLVNQHSDKFKSSIRGVFPRRVFSEMRRPQREAVFSESDSEVNDVS
ncbi:unnamed protein product [Euphydryas editha]|uniref:Uncharacterized protein n=1 Tax=Euphydryas editha TaxID=104508 RepID=A0AAU9V533_EUPED|nr:unnamed protein product [Euphydryas editha]